MSEPSLFPELNMAAEPTDRLFFALFPDAATAARMAEMARVLRGDHRLRGAPLGSDRFHITLSHLGDFVGLPRGVSANAMEAAAHVAMPPLDLVLDRAASFAGKPGRLPFVLRIGDPSGALMDFQRALCVELTKAGVRYKGGSQFTPHVTLLYDAESVPIRAIEPIRWTARDFVLINSLLGKTRHIVLGRWPLSA